MSKTKITRGKGLSRRDLLRLTGGGCAALTEISLLSTLVNLSALRSATAAIDTSGYKALVCVFLFGGIDSYNLLVPTSDGVDETPYDDYATARSALALPRTDLLDITDLADGRGYGLHPGLGGLQSLYADGKLSFVANVGSLIEPVLPATYRNGARLPLGLFSHSDLQRHWQTATPQSRTQITGWLGRMADILTDSVNSNPAISMNIAIDNLNILQTGDGVVPYVVDARRGAELLGGYGSTNVMDQILTASTDSFLEQSYADLLKSTYARQSRQAIDAAFDYNAATTEIRDRIEGEINESYVVLDGTSLGRQLLQVASAIGASGTLGQDRQVFFAARGGWDNHSSLIASQNFLLPEVDSALCAFYEVLAHLGFENDVVTFTASDFARTLNANSNAGSDHAWGGNHIVMGGPVQGGRLHGVYPASLAPGNSLDVGRGRMIPTTSVDEYAAELAMWFGLENDANLEAILPNIRNFYADSETARPLGFTATA